MITAFERRLQMEMFIQCGAIPPELWPDARLMCMNKPPWWRPLLRWRWNRAVDRLFAFAKLLDAKPPIRYRDIKRDESSPGFHYEAKKP